MTTPLNCRDVSSTCRYLLLDRDSWVNAHSTTTTTTTKRIGVLAMDSHNIGVLAMDFHNIGVLAMDCHNVGVLAMDCHNIGVLAMDCHNIGVLAMDCHNTVHFPAVAARLSCPPLRRPGACWVVPRGCDGRSMNMISYY